jgi:hypothetical protein
MCLKAEVNYKEPFVKLEEREKRIWKKCGFGL